MPIRPDFLSRYGPWALVTGAAQGIGLAYTCRLAELGLGVVMVDVNAERLIDEAERIRGSVPGVELRTVVCDLGDRNAVVAMLDSVADLEIGLLVANAAVPALGAWLDVPLDAKVRSVLVNCASPVILADRLTPAMARRRRGGVIIMASGSAQAGSSIISVYAATKAFDRVLAEGLWLELGRYGIDVTTVMPGPVRTPGLADTLPDGKPTKFMERSMAEPPEIVEAALAGLGTKVNIQPGGWLASVLGKALALAPRTWILRLGDRSVRAMYPDR